MFDTFTDCAVAYFRERPAELLIYDEPLDHPTLIRWALRFARWQTTTPPWNTPEVVSRLEEDFAALFTAEPGVRHAFIEARHAALAQVRYGEYAPIPAQKDR
jgi:hypothetical protein